jgi:hypothetical protein
MKKIKNEVITADNFRTKNYDAIQQSINEVMSMVTRMFLSYNPNESNRNDVVYSVIAVEAIDANDFTTSTTKIINLVFRFINDAEKDEDDGCKSVNVEEDGLVSDIIPFKIKKIYDKGKSDRALQFSIN